MRSQQELHSRETQTPSQTLIHAHTSQTQPTVTNPVHDKLLF